VRKLEKLAARIGQPGGVAKFEKEFDRMESRVAELVDRYRRMRTLIAQLFSAGISVEPEPEPEYDAELERRGQWPPDKRDDDPDDLPF
jgi:hypothetical protein